MKKCPQCQKVLARSFFPKDKTRNDGLYCYCRKCTRNYQRSKKYHLAHCYYSILFRLKRCRTYIGRKCEFTKDQLIDFGLSSKQFNRLYVVWKNSGFSQKLTPSIDRIDNSKDYNLENIQFLTISENTKKNIKDCGVANRKMVIATPRNLVFPSVTNGAEFARTSNGNICAAISRNGKSGGYYWQYITTKELKEGKENGRIFEFRGDFTGHQIC